MASTDDANLGVHRLPQPADRAGAAIEPEGGDSAGATADPWAALRRHTPARLALGRAGVGLPTAEVLRFAAAHALARDAVHTAVDWPALEADLSALGWPMLRVHSQAADRATYLRRPDLGRRLAPADAQRLLDWPADAQATPDSRAESAGPAGDRLCIVIGDGLSADAVQRHVRPLLLALQAAWRREAATPPMAPLVLAGQARVALADEVGQCLGAGLVLMLLGERPGLSSPDSLGAYLTHAPAVGRSDAERNCVSNIRPQGLPPEAAAHRLAWLIHEARRRRLTGIGLKDESSVPVLAPAAGPSDRAGLG